MKIIERMYQIMKEKGIRANEVAQAIGVWPQNMTTWKTRNTNPPAEHLPKIAEVLDVPLDYLITGEHTIDYIIENDDEQILIECFRSLPDPKRYEFLGRIKQILEDVTKESQE